MNRRYLLSTAALTALLVTTSVAIASQASHPASPARTASHGEPTPSTEPMPTTIHALAEAGAKRTGERVLLPNVKIDSAFPQGFIVSQGRERIAVVPALMPPSPVVPGNTLTVNGVVTQMTPEMKQRIDSSSANPDVYIYALGVRQ